MAALRSKADNETRVLITGQTPTVNLHKQVQTPKHVSSLCLVSNTNTSKNKTTIRA